jgi:hypothetical protein
MVFIDNSTQPLMLTSPVNVLQVVNKCYNLKTVEKGHSTVGHLSVNINDNIIAAEKSHNLLYGEILPEGVTKIFDSKHLDINNAKIVMDLGMGLGKVLVQAYLQYPHVDELIGVEISTGRYEKSVKALRTLSVKLSAQMFKPLYEPQYCMTENLTANSQIITRSPQIVSKIPPMESKSVLDTSSKIFSGKKSILKPKKLRVDLTPYFSSTKLKPSILKNKRKRRIYFCNGDLFECGIWTSKIAEADIILLETTFEETLIPKLKLLLLTMKRNARLLTYLDLYDSDSNFKRLPCNTVSDRIFTSWAPLKGHRFHLWKRV